MPDSESTVPSEPAVPQPPRNTEATTISPDIGESENAEQLEDAIPTTAYHGLAVVGLGGSAGSLAPLKEFFAGMPADSGMAFVVVLHLSPDFESSMAEILQRSTKMPVAQVREAAKVEPNHVYVIPPAKHLRMTDGTLSLENVERERGKRVTVDLFFRTLADTHGPNAIAVILSGADSDGAIGIKRIKERGGLTVVQDPQECEHVGMPRAAIATGMVDLVLRAAEMPSRLVDFRTNGLRLKVPEFVDRTLGAAAQKGNGDAALRDILSVLRTHTGRDFTGYKKGTILRRIARRMQVNGVNELGAYHAFLRTHPGETGALLQDLLISVTNFFRDREAFDSLWDAFPDLFKGKGPADTLRVWVPACATGEEAYSIAIMLCEYATQLDAPPQLQVFATDIDESAIAVGRVGQYPETIAADVSEERLRRFFVKHKEHYRVSQAVREIVLFAVHDVLRDAPFSRLDLISCRNLLIYFNRDSQSRVFEIIHFALRHDGYLFLGTSETADDASALFFPVHKKHRLYRRLPAQRIGLPLFAGPLSLTLALQAQRRAAEKIVLPLPGRRLPGVGAGADAGDDQAQGISAHELHLRLVEQFAPPSMVVDYDHQVVHLSPNMGRFLQFEGGELKKDVLQLVHPMLRVELRAALFRATENAGAVDVSGVPLELEGGARRLIDISIRAAPEFAPGFLLITFNEREPDPAFAATPLPRSSDADEAIRSLERELESVKQNLRVSREEHGATTEEMKAANEELHAMNEELRSASEELETSREELQSINEELVTVNQDLKAKVDELARSNSDTQNLMIATNVATVFLDGELRIMRYTPPAVALFHLIASDVGRPLLDLRHRLEFDTMLADAEAVLKNFKPIEREVRAADGRWFLARTIVYRTAEDRVEGVVLTFVDVSRIKFAEEALRESEARFRAMVDQTAAGVCLADLAGKISFVNPRLCRMVGRSERELIGRGIADLSPPDEQGIGADFFSRLATRGESFDLERRIVRTDGQPVWCAINVAPIRDLAAKPLACVAVFVDISERKRAEESLRRANDELESRVRERTTALDRSNRMLRMEMEERKRAETAREEIMRALSNTQELERGRISRELHDGVGQHVTALLFGLKSLAKELPADSEEMATLQSLQAIAEDVGREIHAVALELRPTALDDLGLVRALSTFLEDWASRSEIEIEFEHAELGAERLPAAVETTLYRIIGEAVQNAIKHARAKWVSVILHRKGGKVVGIVEDNGIGFEVGSLTAGTKQKRLGLVGMQDRANLLNGELTIESLPNRGTTVIVRLPLTPHENGEQKK